MSGKFGDIDNKCKKTIEHFKVEIGRLRTGRANSALLEGVHVEYYGSMVPLIQLGMVNAPEARLLTVQVYDGGAVESVSKAIQQSELGLNPSREGNLLRIAIPPLNEERRRDLVKRLHKISEETKIFVRNHRRDAVDEQKELEKEKEISQDDLRRSLDEIQKITDKYVADIDVIAAAKEKEILEV